jgi:hypothetical protein
MDEALSSRLQVVERNFLLAAETGQPALAAFEVEWESLLAEIEATLPSLSSATISLANHVTAAIGVLASGFAELEDELDGIHSQAAAERDEILARYVRPPAPTTRRPSPRKTLQDTCYRWFIKNLHDPYPSAAVKASLAETAHRPVANVDVWFQRARRRIRWNEVANDHFGGERHLMQKAAHVFFVEKQQDPLDPEVNMAFMQMQEHAEGMYNDRFRETDFMRTIDKLVKTMPADGVIPTRSGGKRKTKGRSKVSRPPFYLTFRADQFVSIAAQPCVEEVRRFSISYTRTITRVCIVRVQPFRMLQFSRTPCRMVAIPFDVSCGFGAGHA